MCLKNVRRKTVNQSIKSINLKNFLSEQNHWNTAILQFKSNFKLSDLINIIIICVLHSVENVPLLLVLLFNALGSTDPTGLLKTCLERPLVQSGAIR